MSDATGSQHGGKRFDRPVSAAQLFATPEMSMRYPGEIELRRDGADEGEGRGFDNVDLSAGADRTIATPDAAATVVSWFAERLTALGWRDDGNGFLRRDEGETFLARIDRDRGVSRVGSAITDAAGRRLQEDLEKQFYAGVPRRWSVLTLSLIVAPAA
jgi:hypothetical protein